MATTGTYNFPTHKRGDTIAERTFTMQLSDGGDPPVLTPIDLTNVTVSCDFCIGPSRVELREGSGITKTDPANGVFELGPFVLSSSGTWRYDIELTYSDGAVETLVEGEITIEEDITK